MSRTSNSSGFRTVRATFSRFDRCMLRRAIESTISDIEEYPESYMEAFGIESDETVDRTIRSLNRSLERLRLV